MKPDDALRTALVAALQDVFPLMADYALDVNSNAILATPEMLALLTVVREAADHQPWGAKAILGEVRTCRSCGHPWPCLTRQALDTLEGKR